MLDFGTTLRSFLLFSAHTVFGMIALVISFDMLNPNLQALLVRKQSHFGAQKWPICSTAGRQNPISSNWPIWLHTDFGIRSNGIVYNGRLSETDFTDGTLRVYCDSIY